MFFINHTELGEGSAVIIEIEGPLNGESSPDFDDYTWKLVDNNIVYILMDMDKLSFISSEGIGAVLLLQKNVHDKNGLIIFFNLNNEVASLFKLLGFDRVFTVADDRADALQILDRHVELHRTPPEASSEETGTIPPTEATGITEELSGFIDEDSGFDNIIEEPPVESDSEDTGDEFKPFIIECVKCKSLIRINEPGEHICPSCSTEFTVTGENKAEFTLTENTL